MAQLASSLQSHIAIPAVCHKIVRMHTFSGNQLHDIESMITLQFIYGHV